MAVPTPPAWTPWSWRDRPIQQQPSYRDQAAVDAVLREISSLPPLVFSGEVDHLRRMLAECESGKRFLLQGGDCAERFVDCRPEMITNKLKILLQMSLVLSYGARMPVVRVGRIAGQFAKPRSKETEVVGGKEMQSYRGDNINAFEPEEQGRQPDPRRLLRSYHNSAMTLNFIRALISGGFADLHHPEQWDLRGFKGGNQHERYNNLVKQIHDAISFMETLGGVRSEALGSVDFFTSHEGLLLGYEEALTRQVPRSDRFYDLSGHMLWIGERTRQINGAHVEFFRGVANPIGVKVGPSVTGKDVVDLLQTLNPANEQGKIVLITRFGAGRVAPSLPALIEAVRKAGMNCLWCCDPMHGNTVNSDSNLKTRDFSAILSELEQTFSIHRQQGSRLGGVHFELTGENVTECLGGSEGIRDSDLSRNYATYCDPRLNYSQSLEMAFLISSMLS